jgi:hypothetical protein
MDTLHEADYRVKNGPIIYHLRSSQFYNPSMVIAKVSKVGLLKLLEYHYKQQSKDGGKMFRCYVKFRSAFKKYSKDPDRLWQYMHRLAN